MPHPVSLRAVMDELEMVGEGTHVFLNRLTGELFGATADMIDDAESEDDEDLPDWEVEPVGAFERFLSRRCGLNCRGRAQTKNIKLCSGFAASVAKGISRNNYCRPSRAVARSGDLRTWFTAWRFMRHGMRFATNG